MGKLIFRVIIGVLLMASPLFAQSDKDSQLLKPGIRVQETDGTDAIYPRILAFPAGSLTNSATGTTVNFTTGSTTAFLYRDQTPTSQTTNGNFQLDQLEVVDSNIIYVPAGDGVNDEVLIEAYIAAATAGDTLVLASGPNTGGVAPTTSTYILGDDIDVTKAVNIVGQGVGQTIISCPSTIGFEIHLFHITSSNVSLGSMSLVHSSNGSYGVYADGTSALLSNVNISNINFTSTNTSSTNRCIRYVHAEGTIRDVVTRESGTNGFSSIQLYDAQAGTDTLNLYCYNVDAQITTTNLGIGFQCQSVSSNILNMYLYNCKSSILATTGTAYSVIASGTDANIYAENSTFNGATSYDAYQSTSATITLRDCTLLNGTTSGTITRDGEVNTEDLYVSSNGYFGATLNLGADDDSADLYIHDAGGIWIYEDSDDFLCSAVCKDGAAEWQFNDDVNVGSATDTENLYVWGDATIKDDLTVDDLLSYDEADWTGGNVVYVPLAGSIEAYHDAATAGDTLVLAAGTYTITDDIDITKAINIVGQGIGVTTIACATLNKTIFDISASNVRISNMSLSHTGSGSVKCVNTSADLSGIVLENLNISMSGTTVYSAIRLYGSSATLRNITGTVASSGAAVYGVTVSNNSSVTSNISVNAYNCSLVLTGGGGTSYGYWAYNDNDANTITFKLYDCSVSVSGSTSDYALYSGSATTNNSSVTAYGGSFSGATYDAIQTGTNSLTLHGVELANGTTSGTITRDGEVNTQDLYCSNNIKCGDIFCYDPTWADYITMYHDGTDGIMGTNAGAVTLVPTTEVNVILSDALGATALNILDSGTAEVASINSNGDITSEGSLDIGGATAVFGDSTHPCDLYIHDGGGIWMYEDGDNFLCSAVCKDGAAEWQFNDDVNIGAAADAENLKIHNGGTITAYSAGDDKTLILSHNDTNGLITSSDGTISFDNENLTTTGTITGGATITADSTLTTSTGQVLAMNLVNNAKFDMIEDLNNLIGTANIKGFWIFDQTGATTSVTGRDATPKTLTLSANASTLTPAVAGLCPNLTFPSGGGTWTVADNNDFTPGTSGYSVIWLTKPTNMTSIGVQKSDGVSQVEWSFGIASGIPYFISYGAVDASIYVGRYYNTALTDSGVWHCYTATSAGGTPPTTAGHKIYRDGTQIDDTNISAGLMVSVQNGTSPINTAIFGNANSGRADGVILYVSKELTAAEVKRISDRLRAYAGTFL